MNNVRRCVAFILAMLIVMTTQAMTVFVRIDAEEITESEIESTNAEAVTPDTVQLTGICDYESAYQVLEQLNAERTKAGLNQLEMDEELLDAAMLRAAEIVVCYSDTRPDGSGYESVSDAVAQEMILAGQDNAQAVVACWMRTEEAKNAMLEESYKSVGIGCFYLNDTCYWVQCFSTKTAVLSQAFENCEMVYQIPANLSNIVCVVENEKISMKVGETTNLQIQLNSDDMFKPIEVDYDSYTWANSNPQVVNVVKDEITALASGNAKIVAKLGNKKVTVHVTVAEKTTTTEKPGKDSIMEDGTNTVTSSESSEATTQVSATQNITTHKTTNKLSKSNKDKVSLEKTEVTGYMLSQYKSHSSHTSADISIKIHGDVDSSQEVSCQSSNKKVTATAKIKSNVLKINAYSAKKEDTTIKVKIAGKTFKIKLHMRCAHVSRTSYLLVKNSKKKLSVVGCNSSEIKWSSSDSSIATVSEDGTVTGKRIGNVVITAQIGNQRVGCAVSVTTSQIKKVAARARYMGKKWRYSQARRNVAGYYDCSSLVWKAYKMYGGAMFGSSSYPPVAQSEAVWCKKHKCMVKDGFSASNLKNMKVNPGDLLFKSYYSRKSYSGIYHVEMFTGYTCLGYTSDGKPILGTMWGARKVNYAQPQGQLLGRPSKE